jgi:hypothetical protein
MMARTRLGWVDIPTRSLREGLACGEGGVRVMLMLEHDRAPVEPPPAAIRRADAPPDASAANPKFARLLRG